MTTARLSLRIDAKLRNRLEQEAKREERSASFLAIKAIESMLRDRAEKRAAIRSAIQEADRGSFISQDAMDAWEASWETDAETPPPPARFQSIHRDP